VPTEAPRVGQEAPARGIVTPGIEFIPPGLQHAHDDTPPPPTCASSPCFLVRELLTLPKSCKHRGQPAGSSCVMGWDWL
jgi:hypothetical protein